jgi:hypothetical protein
MMQVRVISGFLEIVGHVSAAGQEARDLKPAPSHDGMRLRREKYLERE